MNPDKYIYIYNMGLNQSIEKKIDTDIEEFIYNTVNNYIGNREEIEITDDPYQLKNAILNWFRQLIINTRQIEPFCNKIRGALSTRSVEAQRNIILYLRAHKRGEPFLYVIHTSEKIEVIDEDFKRIIEVGLGPGKILRVLQFSRLSMDSIQLSYREKNKSDLLVNLFHITSDRYKSTGNVILKGSFGSGLDFRIELTPSNFLKHYHLNNIRFEEDNQIEIIEKFPLKLIEIKYRSDYIKPTLGKINNFIKKIKDEVDEHEPLIEEYLMEYQSKKLQYGIEKDMSLTKFLKPDAYPDPDSIKFVEEREFVRCFIDEKLDCSIKKPLDRWGDFFAIDKLIDFSEEFAKDIAREIIIGSLRNVRFINMAYSKEPLQTGRYYWHNSFAIHTNLVKILELIQKEYDSTDSDKKRRLLLIAMLNILDKAIGDVSLTKFSKNVCQNLIMKRKAIISRDIIEDYIFEFKRGDILDPSKSLSERIKRICDGLKPNLNNNGLTILIIGYDEDQNLITPVDLSYYREEVRQKMYKGIKKEFSNQELLINIFPINTDDADKGLIIVNVADKNYEDKIELGNLFG